MPSRAIALLCGALLLGPALARADTREGARVYAQRCAVCHQIVADDGTTIVRGGGSGPNLFGIVGRLAASDSDFDRYGDGLLAAGEGGLFWTEEAIMAYLADPRAFIREKTEDSRAGTRMVFRLRDEEERKAVVTYLANQR